MKILFVTDLCPIKKEEKGLPLTLFNFIEDFKKLNMEVVLLRPNVVLNVLLRKRKLYPEKNYEYCGIKAINKNFWTPFFRLKQFKFLQKEKFDVIFSHMPSGILAANKISKLLNIPYIAAVHASDIKVLKDYKYSFLKKSMKKAYLDAKNIACRSYWLKDEIEKIIPGIKEKTYVIPSGIEADAIAGYDEIKQKAKNFQKCPIKIFSAGNLIKRKNFNVLIEAISKTDDFTLDIAGEGTEKNRLIALVKKNNLENKIKFLGRLNREEIYDKMQEASIFALVSSNETFGMVYLEALSKGCIVICSENSGMAGFIKNGENGFLIKNSEDLIKTLNEIKKIEYPFDIMKNAINTARNLERLKVAQNYLNLIQNILF